MHVDRRQRVLALILAFVLALFFLFAWSNGFNWREIFSISGSASAQGSHSVDLSWTASTSKVAGYRVYVAAVSGGPYTLLTKDLVKGPTYPDKNVKSGKTYYYIVTSVDGNGVESVASKEFTARIP